MTIKYGKTKSEEELEKITQAREIVKTIMNFGVTQQQILLIIQFLGAEINNHENMVEVVTLARELLRGDKVLLIDKGD